MPNRSMGDGRAMAPVDYLFEDVNRSLQPIINCAMELANFAQYADWGARLQGNESVIASSGIVRAFSTIRRYDFLPDNVKAQAARNIALPIGYGQTASQPSTIGQMLEWLQPRRGHKILELGSGSGWTTALLGKIVGTSGRVIGVERVPKLVRFGRSNLSRYAIAGAEIRWAGNVLGAPSEAPFNRILVSAHMPAAWVEELRPQLSPRGGVLVAPVVPDEKYGSKKDVCTVIAVTRHGQEYETEKLAERYSFVPVIRESDDGPCLVGG